ncbi:unnamed protein product, partial [Adineta ricciae]
MLSTMNLEEPIAIIGIACEYAGDIHSPVDFWDALEHSRDVSSDIPRDRTDIMSYFAHMLKKDNDGLLSKQLFKRGYFLSASQWDMFDSGFFDLPKETAASIDPCHRLLMLKFVHLLEDAGYSLEKIQGTKTSIHYAQLSMDHNILTFRMRPEHLSRFQGSNTLRFNGPSRLSYHFNLQGSNRSLDIACASALQGVQLAIQTLRLREADLAVCGGANSMYTPETCLHGSTMGAISTDGKSRSFSIDANGYAKAEGLGLLLLKRLSDAERDGDRIYCVLRDVSSNSDGNEDQRSFLAPSGTGQLRLLKSIYERTRIDPKCVFYVEAHGTGTPIGDPTETNAVGEFFKRTSSDPPLRVGSVKSNLGHTEALSGITSLIKTALCMYHRAISPNMHFKALNAKIQADRYHIEIVQHLVPFPPLSDRNPVLIGVNSFGLGGNNAHAIVEEYQPNLISTNQISDNKCLCDNIDPSENRQHFIFIFSARSQQSLKEQVANFKNWLQRTLSSKNISDSVLFAGIARQLLIKRTISHPDLAILVFANRNQLQEQINSFMDGHTFSGFFLAQRPIKHKFFELCFVFSGQGSEWWAMGKQLYNSEPIFNYWIHKISDAFTEINDGKWCLLHELVETKNEMESRIKEIEIGQPALFAVQIALAALLVSWNVYPKMIVSYGFGECAAAYVAGRITLPEAVRIVYYRSRFDHAMINRNYLNLTISMSKEDVQRLIMEGYEHLVRIAEVNTPNSVTLCGQEKTIRELQMILSILHPNILHSISPVRNAFSLEEIDPSGNRERFKASLKDINGCRPKDLSTVFNEQCSTARYYSSTCGSEVTDQTLDVDFWLHNVQHCINFIDAITNIIQEKIPTAFIELSPEPTLIASIRESFELNNLHCIALPALIQKEDEQTTILSSVAQLTSAPDVWQQYLRTRYIQPTENHSKIFDSFPLYSFNLVPCWYESRELTIERLATRSPLHPLLGVRQWIGQTIPTWRGLININLPENAFLKDHQIQGVILFPSLCFLELVTAAYQQLYPFQNDEQSQIVLEDIEFFRHLLLTEQKLTEIFTQINSTLREWFVYSRPWRSPGEECMRASGLSGTDVLPSFTDLHILNGYSLNEFTLHAHGRIQINTKEKASASIFPKNCTSEIWSADTSSAIYAHLSNSGYQYGSSFRLVETLHGMKSVIKARINNDKVEPADSEQYMILHPTTLDSCLHPLFFLLPDIQATLLPKSIQKLTVSKNALALDGQIYVHGNLCSKVYKSDTRETYQFDLIVASNNKTFENPYLVFEQLAMQGVSNLDPESNISKLSVFEKIRSSVKVLHTSLAENLKAIKREYCFTRTWTDIPCAMNIANLLPSPAIITKDTSSLTIDPDFNESIPKFNGLAACYAQLALEQLKNKVVDERNKMLLNVCCSLASELQEQATFRSTKLILASLLEQYPKFNLILNIMAENGNRLAPFLSAIHDGSDNLSDGGKMKDALALLDAQLFRKTTDFLLRAIVLHLRTKVDREGQSYPKGYRLRVLWLDANDNFDINRTIQSLYDLSYEVGLNIELHYMDTDPIRLQHTQKMSDAKMKDQNGFRIKYMEKPDFSHATLFNDIGNEWYDIVFTGNLAQNTQNVVHYIYFLRRILASNGLLLLSEFTSVPDYFDLIFGLSRQWWSPSENSRAVLDIKQWEEIFQRIDGFSTMQTVLGQFGTSLIIAQKSASNHMLMTFDERKDQIWLILTAGDCDGISDSLISLLPHNKIQVNYSQSNFENLSSTIKQLMSDYNQVHIIFNWTLKPMMEDEGWNMIFAQHEVVVCNALIHMINVIEETKPQFYPFIYILTRHAQPVGSCQFNVTATTFVGLVHSMMMQYKSHRLKLIDLQAPPGFFNKSVLITALVNHLYVCQNADDLDESILCLESDNGVVKHKQCQYKTLENRKKEMTESNSSRLYIVPYQDADQQPFRLKMPSSHCLTDLCWIPDRILYNSHVSTVLVRVHSVNLHAYDILKMLGLQPSLPTLADQDMERTSDFVGTVIRSSSGYDFSIGTRVVGICSGEVLRSHITVDTHQIVCIPNVLNYISDEDIAVLSTSCLTVIYALKHRVNLKSDQIVLIHSGMSVIGQICIQFCLAIGAHVLATAETEQDCHKLRESIQTVYPKGIDIIFGSNMDARLQQLDILLCRQGHLI